MPAAENHRALWNAQVAHSSIMKQIYQGIPLDAASLKHKGDTIRAINCCLQNLSESTKDETIAAIQALATIEVYWQYSINICTPQVLILGLHLAGL
jgi:hypothetical protein